MKFCKSDTQVCLKTPVGDCPENVLEVLAFQNHLKSSLAELNERRGLNESRRRRFHSLLLSIVCGNGPLSTIDHGIAASTLISGLVDKPPLISPVPRFFSNVVFLGFGLLTNHSCCILGSARL